jgi:DNA-binding NarL/FixJ family response regulator
LAINRRSSNPLWDAPSEKKLRISVMTNQIGLCFQLEHMLGQESELSVSRPTHDIEDRLTHVNDAHPDLVLLDWDLPHRQASDVLGRLQKNGCNAKVVVFSLRRDARREALDAGAAAFVCREDPVEQLLLTLLQVGGLSVVFD